MLVRQRAAAHAFRTRRARVDGTATATAAGASSIEDAGPGFAAADGPGTRRSPERGSGSTSRAASRAMRVGELHARPERARRRPGRRRARPGPDGRGVTRPNEKPAASLRQMTARGFTSRRDRPDTAVTAHRSGGSHAAQQATPFEHWPRPSCSSPRAAPSPAAAVFHLPILGFGSARRGRVVGTRDGRDADRGRRASHRDGS